MQLTLAVICVEEILPPLFVANNLSVTVKNTFGWSPVMVCAWHILQLFSLVFCVVKAVRKSDFRLVINEAPDKWRPVERRSRSDTGSCFWQDLWVCFLPTTVESVRGLYPRCAGRPRSLHKGTVFPEQRTVYQSPLPPSLHTHTHTHTHTHVLLTTSLRVLPARTEYHISWHEAYGRR